MKSVILLAVVALLVPTAAVARTHKITLEIQSSPDGAEIVGVGAAPRWLTYEITGDCGQTLPITVRWASGAETTHPVTLCAKTGKRQAVTAMRPTNVAGIEIDLQVAYQAAMLRQMQALTRAASDPPAYVPPVTIPHPVTCITTPVIGGPRGQTYVACQ